jgi:DNA-binding MarR family transcriptional regulator
LPAKVIIELTDRQLASVLRQTKADHSVAAMISGFDLKLTASAAFARMGSEKGASRSLVRGLLVLSAFPATGEPRRLSDVADELKMSTSTLHRYLSTLLALGLIERDEPKRLYRRGTPVVEEQE